MSKFEKKGKTAQSSTNISIDHLAQFNNMELSEEATSFESDAKKQVKQNESDSFSNSSTLNSNEPQNTGKRKEICIFDNCPFANAFSEQSFSGADFSFQKEASKLMSSIAVVIQPYIQELAQSKERIKELENKQIELKEHYESLLKKSDETTKYFQELLKNHLNCSKKILEDSLLEKQKHEIEIEDEAELEIVKDDNFPEIQNQQLLHQADAKKAYDEEVLELKEQLEDIENQISEEKQKDEKEISHFKTVEQSLPQQEQDNFCAEKYPIKDSNKKSTEKTCKLAEKDLTKDSSIVGDSIHESKENELINIMKRKRIGASQTEKKASSKHVDQRAVLFAQRLKELK
ncbi:uncharacterized protein MONOS_18627 [Monocercomonoides exilis]|uniref:uncharacterized protein n=1 Tax=Monocercomonoides exilis TaxID=2049356 RepID=UPI00355A99D9|nr:hypothetical protein MONOS_18627 [Monocercomonoides exilis]